MTPGTAGRWPALLKLPASRRRSHWIGMMAFAVALCPYARAHDPFEIWTLATLRPDALVFEVTMAKATALRLVDPEEKLRAPTMENFSESMRRLQRDGPALLALHSAGKALAPSKVQVELTEENDVALKLTYPRPLAGKLGIRAAFLKKLGEDYGGILAVSDADGADLAWDQLTFERTTLEVEIPPAKPRK